tara:strand:+ start:347 stop:1741 length:1395 start_codon:yes stop_codon:yes gene_type:complete
VKITQDEVVERQTVLHIELEDNDIDPYLDRAYRRVVQRANVPGFRKGKAPRRIIEQYFGRESLLNEVLDSMLPELTGKAITEKDLDAVGLPSIDLEGLEPFQFSAIVPLRPEVDLGEYKSIRLNREEPSLPDDAVDERIEQLRVSVASWEPVERTIEVGDMISAQINGNIGAENIIDENEAVYLINEDIGRPFPGFTDKLVGLGVDEPHEFDLDIPDDFRDENLAGKKASFNVTVKDIKERVLPELDDDFAHTIGEGYDSLDDLREEVDKSLKTESDAESSRAFREVVIEALMGCATVELPPLLVEHESTHMVEEQERMVSQANMVLDDYLQSMGKTRSELEEESREEALTRLTRSFVISSLAEEEEIEVSDEEIEERLEELFADSDQETPSSSQTEEMKDYLQRSMRMERTMERLESIAEGKSTSDVGESSDEDTDTPEIDESTDTADKNTENEGGDEDVSQS